MRKVENIIFDLGGVLLDLDWGATAKEFEALGLQTGDDSYRGFLTNPALLKFETGEIEPSVFYDEVRRILKNTDATNRQIRDAWCAMIGDVSQSKIDLLRQLFPSFRLFLFSNTNKLHIDLFKERFSAQYGFNFEEMFEQTFYSHCIHNRKPLTSSFEKVVSLAGIEKTATLFIDDSKDNVEGASKAGLQSLHYPCGANLEKAITDFINNPSRSSFSNEETGG